MKIIATMPLPLPKNPPREDKRCSHRTAHSSLLSSLSLCQDSHWVIDEPYTAAGTPTSRPRGCKGGGAWALRTSGQQGNACSVCYV